MTNNKIAWDELHHHLLENQKRMDSHFQKSAEEIQKILHQRAEQLQQQEKSINSSENTLSVVVFRLGNEHYGIESEYVNCVNTVDKITTLPSVPASIAGVINLHGNIFAVLNIRQFLGLSCTNDIPSNTILVINHSTMKVGILVDSILGTEKILASDIQKSLPVSSKEHAIYFKGLTRNLTMILDIPTLLTTWETL